MTNANPIRVAQIGCGYWGKNLARTLGKLGVLAAIVDGDVALAERMCEEHGGEPRTLAEVLADPTITAVSIATPAETHAEIASVALRAGKDVFVEKPMALNPGDAAKLAELATNLGRVLMVGHLLQYHPAFLKMLEVIRSGDLGRLRYVYSNRLNFGKIRREEDILWSFAPHDLSMILSIAGEKPSSVDCSGTFALHEEIADVTITHLNFPSGLRAHVFVSWLHPFKEQKLVVVGDNAMAVFDDRKNWPEKLALFKGSVEWQDGIPIARPVEPVHVEIEEAEPLACEMQHFIDCVETRATPRTDGEEGLGVLEVLASATASLLEPVNAERAASSPSGVHETAVIDEGAKIGEGTKIWHFSHVLPGSRIGEDCSLGQNVVVGPNVSIGSGTKIQNNVSVYEGVTLEEDVFCGPSMVFTNVTTPRAFVSRKSEFAPTLIRHGASIGANATVVCGATVGRYALIGAGAVVTGDVPDYALMLGIPARQAGWVSEAGEVLDDDLVCPRTGDSYTLTDGVLERNQS